MTENEMQLQMSRYVDKKLKPLQYEMQMFRKNIGRGKCDPLVDMLLDDWMLRLEAMRADIEILEKVVAEHSEAIARLEAKAQLRAAE